MRLFIHILFVLVLPLSVIAMAAADPGYQLPWTAVRTDVVDEDDVPQSPNANLFPEEDEVHGLPPSLVKFRELPFTLSELDFNPARPPAPVIEVHVPPPNHA